MMEGLADGCQTAYSGMQPRIGYIAWNCIGPHLDHLVGENVHHVSYTVARCARDDDTSPWIIARCAAKRVR